MYCNYCGTQLQDNSRFCHICGKSVGSNAATNTSEPVPYEQCQIEGELTRRVEISKPSFLSSGKGNAYFRFRAKAIGPQGTYIAGESEEMLFHHKGYDFNLQTRQFRFQEQGEDGVSRVEVHKSLILKLVQQGWEPVSERGSEWWQVRFKRRISQ